MAGLIVEPVQGEGGKFYLIMKHSGGREVWVCY